MKKRETKKQTNKHLQRKNIHDQEKLKILISFQIKNNIMHKCKSTY